MKALQIFLTDCPQALLHHECHIHCPDNEKFTAVERLSQQIGAVMPAEQMNLIDGVRLTTASGWCLIRASNTEPALVARAQGENETALDEMIEFLRKQLRAAGISWDGP